MITDVAVEPMTRDFIMWRCLHGGALSADTIDEWDAESGMPWADLHSRNVPLLGKLIDTYGTCMMLARDGGNIVGMLFFLPKDIAAMDGAGFFCLQQDPPGGPCADFAEKKFPSLDEIQDRTLTVRCVMTGSPKVSENPHQRRGIGTRMAQALIDWAKGNGWKGLEAESFEDLPTLYENTGNAGRGFWEKLGFRIVSTEKQTAFEHENDFTRKLREEATAKGLDPEAFKKSYTMRLDLA
jgi:GNAT superfamily N-acetyltransferase